MSGTKIMPPRWPTCGPLSGSILRVESTPSGFIGCDRSNSSKTVPDKSPSAGACGRTALDAAVLPATERSKCKLPIRRSQKGASNREREVKMAAAAGFDDRTEHLSTLIHTKSQRIPGLAKISGN
jgi:hypothetical protein